MNLPAVHFDKEELEPHADAMIAAVQQMGETMCKELEPHVDAMIAAVQRMGETMCSMAGMIKAACEKIDRLEAQIRRMEKVTPEQAKNLNELIRNHSIQLCKEYGIVWVYGCPDDGAAKIRAMIRAGIRQRFGCQVKDLCRMDAEMCEEFIKMWEDTPRLLRLRRKQDDEAGL